MQQYRQAGHTRATYKTMKTNSERYQVILLQDGTETDLWTDYKNVAVSLAEDMRRRHPDASVVVVLDHAPVPTYF